MRLMVLGWATGPPDGQPHLDCAAAILAECGSELVVTAGPAWPPGRVRAA